MITIEIKDYIPDVENERVVSIITSGMLLSELIDRFTDAIINQIVNYPLILYKDLVREKVREFLQKKYHLITNNNLYIKDWYSKEVDTIFNCGSKMNMKYDLFVSVIELPITDIKQEVKDLEIRMRRVSRYIGN